MLKLWYSGCYIDCYLQVVRWGFRKLLNWIANEFKNPPILITDNGYLVSGSNSELLWQVVCYFSGEATYRNSSDYSENFDIIIVSYLSKRFYFTA